MAPRLFLSCYKNIKLLRIDQHFLISTKSANTTLRSFGWDPKVDSRSIVNAPCEASLAIAYDSISQIGLGSLQVTLPSFATRQTR